MSYAPGPYRVGLIGPHGSELIHIEEGTVEHDRLYGPAATVTMRTVAIVPNCGNYTTGNIALFRMAPDLVGALARLLNVTEQYATLFKQHSGIDIRLDEVAHARALLRELGVEP